MNFENFSQNSFKIFFLDLKYKTRFLNSHLHFSIKKNIFLFVLEHTLLKHTTLMTQNGSNTTYDLHLMQEPYLQT